MMCTSCLRVDQPETVLDGSDFLELVGWCLLAVPGLAYCWWRHVNRLKACPHCGSSALVRQARAAAARCLPDAAPSGRPRIRNRAGPVRWPIPLAHPRARMRRGGVIAGLLGVALIAWALGMLDVVAAQQALPVVSGSGLLSGVWLVLQGVRFSRQRVPLWEDCRAWDSRGRPLRIEPI